MKKKTIIIMLVVFLLVILPVYGAPTITSSIVTDWTAVGEAGIGESGTIDISGSYAVAIHIQAFLDMDATAHEGTEFVIQVSGLGSGDEDWSDYMKFKELIGTANFELIDDNPLAATSTTITVSDTGGGYETEPMGKWIAIEDGTLINSELVFLVAFTTDTDLTIQDGTTNQHANTVNLMDIALSRTIVMPIGAGSRARVIINNGIDIDGTASSLNYKIGKTITTGI
jgi:hypothetical protein